VADDIPFDRSRPEPGRLEQVSPLIRRWVNPNPGPFTFTGTCTYVIGHGRVAVVDPGPERAGAAEELLQALGREAVSNILITHTHRDHSPGAVALKALTGAMTAGCGPHRAARDLGLNERNILDASADMDFRADREMQDGDVLAGEGWTLTALTTPGHTMNHLCFALREEKALVAGDHVMAWSTTIVAPPDGSMSAYMASLDKLRDREETIYWPGHGGPVTEPKRFLRALIGHRKMREGAILEQLRGGAQVISALVERMYVGLAPNLKGAAALSVFAHLEDLVTRELAACDGQPTLDAIYRLR
jgi:glyoxylase-like metal-dependent hydrolase (beta-lactamase superfamily II)